MEGQLQNANNELATAELKESALEEQLNAQQTDGTALPNEENAENESGISDYFKAIYADRSKGLLSFSNNNNLFKYDKEGITFESMNPDYISPFGLASTEELAEEQEAELSEEAVAEEAAETDMLDLTDEYANIFGVSKENTEPEPDFNFDFDADFEEFLKKNKTTNI